MNEYLVVATFRVALLILAGAAASVLLKKKSAALRAAAWTAVAGVAIFLPVLPALLGSVVVPVKSAPLPSDPAASSQLQLLGGAPSGVIVSGPRAKKTLQGVPSSIVSPLEALYLGGVGFSALWFLIALAGAGRIVRRAGLSLALTEKARSIAQEMGVPKGPKVLLGPVGIVPFTLGAFSPVILLPDGAEEWGDEKLNRVLRHETGHIARNDWAVMALARTACAVHWFNPLVWMAARELRQECEKAADDLAVQTLETSAYAAELLGWAKSVSAPTVALPMARPSNMGKRIRHVLDRNADRSPVSGGLKVFIGAGCVLGALIVPGIGAQSTPDMLQLRLKGIDHAKHIALAYLMYENDYDDITPYVDKTETVRRITFPYLKADHPAQGDKVLDNWKTMNPEGSVFLVNLCLGGISDTQIPEPANTPLFYESKPWKDGKRLVAYSDGHVKVLDSDAWKKAEPYLHLQIKRRVKNILKADPITGDEAPSSGTTSEIEAVSPPISNGKD